MNIKETYIIAHNNIKGRKKTGRIIFFIFFLALFIYLLVNSLVYSIDNLVGFIREVPSAKTLIYYDLDEDTQDGLKELCKDMEHVTDVYDFVYPIPIQVEGLKENEKKLFEVKSFSDGYTKYMVEGEIPKENEIILPQYMYMEGTSEYEEGSKYIGKTLTLYVENYYGEKSSMTCRVSGTYDNIYAATGHYTALLYSENAVKLYELSEEGIEYELDRLMEENPSSVYIGFEKQYHSAVVIENVDDLDEVREWIQDKLGIWGSQETLSEENELKTVFSYVQFIGMIITVILLVVVIIMMVIMIGNDVRGRKKEMAMYLVQGYTRKNLLLILSMEYAMRLTPVLIVSTIVTLFTLLLVNKGKDELLGMEYQVLSVELSLDSLAMAVVILIIVMCMAVYTISEQLKRIELLKEIKSEG